MPDKMKILGLSVAALLLVAALFVVPRDKCETGRGDYIASVFLVSGCPGFR
jgi:hypothetical protein